MSSDSSEHGIPRRHVLQATGMGVFGALGVGGVAAQQPDRYIVGTSSQAAVMAARSRADSVRHVLDFGDIGQAVAGRFSMEALEQLGERSDVRYIEVDGTMEALHHKPGHSRGGGDGGGSDSGECLPWGIDRVDADVAANNGNTGSGSDIAIIDTGIDPDHPDLQGNLGSGKAFVKCRGNCSEPWADDNDHGTHCAGIAAAINDNSEGVQGVATDATLHAVKVLDKQGSGSLSDVAAGIEYTADQGWHVGSLSLGTSSDYQTLKDACNYAYNNGVLLVAAAGNDGPCTDCVSYPAAYSEAIAVSATSKDDTLAGFSSTGPEVELAAPGENIYSSVIDGYDTFSGTSMACPHVSGAGGVLMANGKSNINARDTLNSNAEDISLPSNESGSGLLDVAAALGLDSSDDGTGNC